MGGGGVAQYCEGVQDRGFLCEIFRLDAYTVATALHLMKLHIFKLLSFLSFKLKKVKKILEINFIFYVSKKYTKHVEVSTAS